VRLVDSFGSRERQENWTLALTDEVMNSGIEGELEG